MSGYCYMQTHESTCDGRTDEWMICLKVTESHRLVYMQSIKIFNFVVHLLFYLLCRMRKTLICLLILKCEVDSQQNISARPWRLVILAHMVASLFHEELLRKFSLPWYIRTCTLLCVSSCLLTTTYRCHLSSEYLISFYYYLEVNTYTKKSVQDYAQIPPAQELKARDLHDQEWHFRHIYRGIEKFEFRNLFPANFLLCIGYLHFLVGRI